MIKKEIKVQVKITIGKCTALTVKFVLNFMDKKRIDNSKVKTKTNMTVQVVEEM